MMYRRTDEMLTPALRRRAEEKHLSIHDLITIASMVEREARLKEDQVPIASVILARLESRCLFRLMLLSSMHWAGRKRN